MGSKLLDTVLEVETPSEVSASLEGLPRLAILDVRLGRRGLVNHLLVLPRSSLSKVRKVLTRLGFEVVAEGGDHRVAALMVKRSCAVCKALLVNGASSLSGAIGGSRRAEFRFLVDHASLRRILYQLGRLGLPYNVKRVHGYRLQARLTPIQERVLMDALREGFFDYPRRIALSDMARRLGVAPSTLSEVLRRGIRKLLEEHLPP